jgi:hypothetical protein
MSNVNVATPQAPTEDLRHRRHMLNPNRPFLDNDFYSWREGEALIFDDTFNHEVWNDTAGYRVVLFVDFARPLYQPFHWLNERLLNFGALAPFLRKPARNGNAGRMRFGRKKRRERQINF